MMTIAELHYRLDESAERYATILVAFCRLATAYHATHASAGLWLTCDDPVCHANATNLRRWRGESSRHSLTGTGSSPPIPRRL
jgi:hypothetical protein